MAVVLGAAVAGEAPSLVFASRLDHAAESAVGRRYLHRPGVPDSVLSAEARSRTTRQNLASAAPLLGQGDAVVLVPDPLHLWRTRWQARDLGFDPLMSATPTSRYRSLRARLPFLGREVWVAGVYGLIERWAPAACPAVGEDADQAAAG